MILQLGGLGNLIDGIATAVSAAHNFVDEESVKGKSSIWYQWGNSEVSVTDWWNLRKERYKHYSH